MQLPFIYVYIYMYEPRSPVSDGKHSAFSLRTNERTSFWSFPQPATVPSLPIYVLHFLFRRIRIFFVLSSQHIPPLCKLTFTVYQPGATSPPSFSRLPLYWVLFHKNCISNTNLSYVRWNNKHPRVLLQLSMKCCAFYSDIPGNAMNARALSMYIWSPFEKKKEYRNKTRTE